MDKSIISFVVGFVVGNIVNFVELFFIIKTQRDISNMLKQFKAEGHLDKWLK